MKPSKVDSSFYSLPTVEVARRLIGKSMVRIHRGRRLVGRIVETEAYLGAADAASHARRGLRSERNKSLYLAGGHAYVYLIYGLHSCLNVVTRAIDVPEAVLIRAVEPLEGLELMKKNRPVPSLKLLTNGPGKLCQAFKISRKQDGLSFLGDELFIEEPELRVDREDIKIMVRPRVGVDYAGLAARWPLRFYEKGSCFVSRL